MTNGRSARQPIAFLPEAHTDFVFRFVPEMRWFAAILGIVGCLAAWRWSRKRAR